MREIFQMGQSDKKRLCFTTTSDTTQSPGAHQFPVAEFKTQ